MSAAKSPLAGLRGAAPLFAALGDETRLRLVLRLATAGPGSIAHLSEKASVSRQAIKKHLDVLESAGMVRGERRGREHYFRLETKRLHDARDYLATISEQWDGAIARLRDLVEKD
jgi:DNA-binding transcriptional ArsR family regulator